MCGGAAPAPPPAKTLAQMQAATDNPYENPGSGTADPKWKLAVKEPETKKETTAPKTKKRSDLYG